MTHTLRRHKLMIPSLETALHYCLVATLVAAPLLLAVGGARAQSGVTTADLRSGEAKMPRYDDEGQLLLPEDYLRWVLVGSSLGLSYSEGAPSHEMFHHTYMEPTAFEHYVKTGEFRDGTMLALTLYGLGEGVAPGRRGRFADDLHAVEMAVKDQGRFEEGWAYYGFGGSNGLRPRAQAFAKESCYSCHAEHAARDNVFVQFYTVLRQVRSDPQEGGVTAAHASVRADEGTAAPQAPLALEGLDPVFLTEGREEMGKPEIIMTHQGYRYQFITEVTRSKFEESPKTFSIQNESCPVVPGAPVNPALYTVHENKIYTFATDNCRQQFEENPESFLDDADG